MISHFIQDGGIIIKKIVKMRNPPVGKTEFLSEVLIEFD